MSHDALAPLLAALPAPGAALPAAVAEARGAFVTACRPHFGEQADGWPWAALRPALAPYLTAYATAAATATGAAATALQELDLLNLPTSEGLLRPPVHPLHAVWLAAGHPAPAPCPLVLPRSAWELYHLHGQPAPGWALYVPDQAPAALPPWAHAATGHRLADALRTAAGRLALPSPIRLLVLTRGDIGPLAAALAELVADQWELLLLAPTPLAGSPSRVLRWQDYLAAPVTADLAVVLDLAVPHGACCAPTPCPTLWPLAGPAPGAGPADLRWHFPPPGAVLPTDESAAAALAAHHGLTLRQLTRRRTAAVPGLAATLAPEAHALLTTVLQHAGLTLIADPWLPPALLDRPAAAGQPLLVSPPATPGAPWAAVRPPAAAWTPLANHLSQAGLPGPVESWQELLRAVAPDAVLHHLTAPAPLLPLLAAARLALAAPRPWLPVAAPAPGLLYWLDLDEWPRRLGLYAVLLDEADSAAALAAWRARYAVRLRHWLGEALQRAARFQLLPAARLHAAAGQLARLLLDPAPDLWPRRLLLAPQAAAPLVLTVHDGVPLATLGAPGLAALGTTDAPLARQLADAWREPPPVLAYRRAPPTALPHAAESRTEYDARPPGSGAQ
jgi:hypothetical protein